MKSSVGAFSRKLNNSNTYCSQLDQLEGALNKKDPESVNRKCMIFHQDDTRLTDFDDWTKAVTARLGSSDSSAVFLTMMSIYFCLYKILLMEKFLTLWKTVEVIWNSSFLKKISSGKMEF